MAAPLIRQFSHIETFSRSYSLLRNRFSTYSRFISAISLQRLMLATVSKCRQTHLTQIAQRLQSCRFYTETSQAEADEEADVLYRQLVVEVKGHDPEVMNSYKTFVTQAAKELDINLHDFEVPKKHIERRTLLKSVHIFKKHRTQYEMRTHFNIYTFKHLTGSTADTFLEYIQRNLPEGMAMKVTRHRLEKFPEHLKTLKTEEKTES